MNIKSIIIEYQDFLNSIAVEKRDYYIDENANYVITGIRRAGKTWFLFQIAGELLKSDFEKLLYINFEDDRFIDFQAKDFDKLLNAYYELYPDNKPVVFLDEVQIIKGWQKFCRRLADQQYRVYITGSNAEMLSSDIASVLGGRYIPLEINPLSFPEYLRFNKLTAKATDIFGNKKNKIKKLFNEYFRFGGFPEIINIADKRGYLHNIYTTVLYNDIVVRNKIRDTYGLRLLVKKIAESTNDELSYRRMTNLLDASGAKIGTSTIISWIEALKNSFLIRELRNLNYKFSERESRKKYYFVDNGLLTALGVEDDSKLFETLVFNVLRMLHNEMWFFKTTNAEVDFVVPGKIIYQASYDVSDPVTKQREINSLIKAGDFLNISKLAILTYDYEETCQNGSKTIEIIPLWKFILMNFWQSVEQA